MIRSKREAVSSRKCYFDIEQHWDIETIFVLQGRGHLQESKDSCIGSPETRLERIQNRIREEQIPNPPFLLIFENLGCTERKA